MMYICSCVDMHLNIEENQMFLTCLDYFYEFGVHSKDCMQKINVCTKYFKNNSCIRKENFSMNMKAMII